MTPHAYAVRVGRAKPLHTHDVAFTMHARAVRAFTPHTDARISVIPVHADPRSGLPHTAEVGTCYAGTGTSTASKHSSAVADEGLHAVSTSEVGGNHTTTVRRKTDAEHARGVPALGKHTIVVVASGHHTGILDAVAYHAGRLAPQEEGCPRGQLAASTKHTHPVVGIAPYSNGDRVPAPVSGFDPTFAYFESLYPGHLVLLSAGC